MKDLYKVRLLPTVKHARKISFFPVELKISKLTNRLILKEGVWNSSKLSSLNTRSLKLA
jgi:hypothetical protein